jgi:acetyl-CoA carboxylase carboxyltransferase component
VRQGLRPAPHSGLAQRQRGRDGRRPGQQGDAPDRSGALKGRGEEITPEAEKELLDKIRKKYEETTSPYYAASRLWLDAVIDPLETRTWISMGIEAAAQSPATKEFNMGVLQV